MYDAVDVHWSASEVPFEAFIKHVFPNTKHTLPASPERGVFFSSSYLVIVRVWCGIRRWWGDLSAQSAHSHHPTRAPHKLSNFSLQRPESLLFS